MTQPPEILACDDARVRADRRISTAEIASMFGVSRKTVTDRWIKAPDFPKPIQQISRKSRWWSLKQVQSWRASA